MDGDPINKMAAYQRNKDTGDRSPSSYLNNEKSQLDNNKVSVITLNIIHVADIDI